MKEWEKSVLYIFYQMHSGTTTLGISQPFLSKNTHKPGSKNFSPRYLTIKMETYVQQTGVVTEILCVIAEDWKQSRCLLIGEWINKLWYIHSMEQTH